MEAEEVPEFSKETSTSTAVAAAVPTFMEAVQKASMAPKTSAKSAP